MTDQEEADNGQVKEETGLIPPEDEETEPDILPAFPRNATREEVLQALGDIITIAGHKAARGRFKNPAAEQLRIRYLTLAKDSAMAYNAVLKDQEIEDLDRMVSALEEARYEA